MSSGVEEVSDEVGGDEVGDDCGDGMTLPPMALLFLPLESVSTAMISCW